MGLLDLIETLAEKAYDKHKEANLEKAMNRLLESIQSLGLNLEPIPYVEGDDPNILKGKVYKLKEEDIDKSTSPYFFITSRYLLKAGIDLENDKTYSEALAQKSGYGFLVIWKKYPNLAQNYSSKYNLKGVSPTVLIILSDSKNIMYTPNVIKDPKDKSKLALAKKIGVDNISPLDIVKIKNFEAYKKVISKNGVRARLFAYYLANELSQYDKDDIEKAFGKFEEKHGKNAEITYKL